MLKTEVSSEGTSISIEFQFLTKECSDQGEELVSNPTVVVEYKPCPEEDVRGLILARFDTLDIQAMISLDWSVIRIVQEMERLAKAAVGY